MTDVVEADERAVDQAVARARLGFAEWRSQPVTARATALAQVADAIGHGSDELTQLIVREVGKPVSEARAEVARTVQTLGYHAQMAFASTGETYPGLTGGWLSSSRVPTGVNALITPWNFPALIPAWKLAPCLIAGNAAVLKPSPLAAGVADWLASRLQAALPDGVLSVVHGDADVARALLRCDIDAVSFTGSAAAGRSVAMAAAGSNVKAQCEMGGLNPSVVLESANLPSAAQAIASSILGYAGQKCTATRRVIVADSVYDDFRDLLMDAIDGAVIGDPRREETAVGPLISASAVAAASSAVQSSEGAVVTARQPADLGPGFFAPTLVEGCGTADVLRRQEVFAPVAVLIHARHLSHAVSIANEGRSNLSAAVFTQDLAEAMAFVEDIEAGLIKVNAPSAGVDFHVPFGGHGAASFGPREQGMAALDFYSETRTVAVRA